MRAGEIARIGPAEVRARYGVDPAQVPDFIALRGDPSDRLAGRAGVGPQGAADVLRRYGSLEGALTAGRFADAGQGAAALSLDRHHGPQGAAAARCPTRRRPGQRRRRSPAAWQLNQLADRLDELVIARTA